MGRNHIILREIEHRMESLRAIRKHCDSEFEALQTLLDRLHLEFSSASISDPIEQACIDWITSQPSSETPYKPGSRLAAPSGPVETLSAAQDARTRRRDIFVQFEQFREAFTEPQWLAVCLYYRDGLSDRAVGKKLKISERAAYDRRRRAEREKVRQEKALREERLRLIRKYANS